MPEDGHAIKLARAAGICRDVTEKYQDRDWVLIKGDDTWDRINHLIIDSLQGGRPGEYWARGGSRDDETVSLLRFFVLSSTCFHPCLGGNRLLTRKELGASECSQAVTLRARSAGGRALESLRKERTSKFLKLGKSLCLRTIPAVATLGSAALDKLVDVESWLLYIIFV